MEKVSQEIFDLIISNLYSGSDIYGNEHKKPFQILESEDIYHCYFNDNNLFTSHSYRKNEKVILESFNSL